LTGLAQINGRDDLSIPKKAKFDKIYCDNWSLKLDLTILLKSFKTVAKQEGFHEGKYHRR
ncbi:MAG: sugar transferase, partial [Eubacterium sp.]|nr:sugar transferase [Eubacterium sp.]